MVAGGRARVAIERIGHESRRARRVELGESIRKKNNPPCGLTDRGRDRLISRTLGLFAGRVSNQPENNGVKSPASLCLNSSCCASTDPDENT